AELVKLLEHPNGWRRTTAQRLLLTSPDPAVVPALADFAKATRSPEGLIHAAWLLEAKEKLPPALPQRMATHWHPRVREHAARLLELHPAEDVIPTRALFKFLAADPDVRVRFQAVLS